MANASIQEKKILETGKKYRVTAEFAEVAGAPWLLGKEVIYEGLVTETVKDPRDGNLNVTKHSFAVVGSQEKILCDKNASLKHLYKLLME